MWKREGLMEEMEIFKSNLILQLHRNTPSFLISLILSCIDISVTSKHVSDGVTANNRLYKLITQPFQGTVVKILHNSTLE
jgi:hypothetical protein